ncbi:PAS domain S-box protein [Roseovarius sp. A21]|uniref:histidine kinase n=1 Tax=Roseovarius bejariae TaxID=2576383 RepID=A0A844CRN7_9RHOB|nr:PAS domain S-box protein [Roseovarius bejariae]MRU16115.1 PAS domain S-box protein [Roseovarius bejariae]
MAQKSYPGQFDTKALMSARPNMGAWFEGVFEHAAMGIVVTDLHGRIQTCNPAYLSLVGHDAQALEGMTAYDLIHPEDLPDFMAKAKPLLSGKLPFFEIETRYRRADGKVIWVHIRVSLLPDESGTPGHMLSLISDISERKQFLAELQGLRDRLERFIEDAPTPMAMFDHEMRYIRCSRRWLDDYDLNGEQIEGKRHYDLFPDLPDSWIKAHRRGLAGEIVKCREDWFLRPDQTVQWLRWEVHPWHEASGEIAGVIVFAEDVSDRKRAEQSLRESEARLRLAAEAAHFGTFDIDLATGQAHWSPEARGLLGLPPEASPQTIDEMERHIGPRAMLQIRSQLQSAFDPTGSGRLKQDLGLTLPNGNRRWLQVHGRVIFSKNGPQRHATRVRGMLMDVTETRQMQRRLENSKRLESIGRLSSGIAHDFNNLLTVILSNLELAQRRTSDPETQALLDTAIEASEMGATFNSRLLSLARTRRVQPGVLQVDRHLASIWPILSRAVGDTIDLKILHNRKIWTVRADTAELDSALLNLVVNARDAMPHGGQITIGAKNVTLDADAAEDLSGATPGEYVRIFVKDTGLGMPPEIVEQAQEPFFTTKSVGRGTGLGLTSAAAFAARENGCMQIESAPGRGTTVSVLLPRDHDDQQAGTNDGGEASGITYGDGEVILVVEDDDLVRETVLKRLEVLGYVVCEARDAVSACKMLDEGHHVDLVFSDVAMPGDMSGHDLADWVRAKHPAVGLLLTTGNVVGGTDPKDSSNGVQILPKPYSIARLGRKVHDALRRRLPSPV